MTDAPLLPIALNLKDRLCVVAGGGRIALRKVRDLTRCGALVRVVAPEALPEIEELAAKNAVVLARRRFDETDIEDAFLVVAATDDEDTNRRVRAEATRRGVLCNVVDRPEQCDFHAAAILARGDLQVAITTNGRAPALAKALRRRLEHFFCEEWVRVMDAAARLRDAVRRRHPADAPARMADMERLLQADMLLEALEKRDVQTIDAVLDTWNSYSSE